jgi:histidine triad (HIT) family protein
MASLFTKIIRGELPGRFVWRDERCVAFLTIQPIRPGHTLVVPVEEVDHWIDMAPELSAHVFSVARDVGAAIQRGFRPRKVGLSILGLEVPHAHVHVMQVDSPEDLVFANQRSNVPAHELDAAAETIRNALNELGLGRRAQALR